MNVAELLRPLQAEHDETTARADHLREQTLLRVLDSGEPEYIGARARHCAPS
ncbi:hypothetical protein ACF1BU_37570 [Streptomyces sp. NPDC014724]|uniref:hypothetical protein n=1 Tax=unclassified Streptomyces TaxID=2593676 RepID=UPI0037034D1C